MNTILKNLDPAVPPNMLIFLAGMVWFLVGILLNALAIHWLTNLPNSQALFFAIPGIILAIIIHRYGFSKIVAQNLERLLKLTERVCLFAFIPWKSYLIIFVMVNLGIFLRQSALPKPWLSIIYIGIGLAMVLSSMAYLRSFSQQKN